VRLLRRRQAPRPAAEPFGRFTVLLEEAGLHISAVVQEILDLIRLGR